MRFGYKREDARISMVIYGESLEKSWKAFVGIPGKKARGRNS
jgi:hypothetical protein